MKGPKGNLFFLWKCKKKISLIFLPKIAEFVCGKWSESNVRRNEYRAQLQYFVTTVMYVQVPINQISSSSERIVAKQGRK
jgi:hypothetical protein